MTNHKLLTGCLALLGAICMAPEAQAQNLWAKGGGRHNLIQDLRARYVGDILTITVAEVTQVQNNDTVERSNETSLSAQIEAFNLSQDTFKTNVLPEFDVRQNRSFDGESRQIKQSNVQASIAVVVIDRQPNGNLVVAGTRTVTVDDETKTLRISGIVREYDISFANTITSAQVADARISLTGDGGSNRVLTRGPVGALFDTLIWAAWPF